MKRTFTKLSFFVIIALIATLCFGACDNFGDDTNGDNTNNNNAPVVVSLQLSADKTQVKSGDTVTLTATLKSADKTETLDGLTYTITAGADVATLNGNVITIAESVAAATTVKVKTTYNGVESNELVINVAADEVVVEGVYYINCPESNLTIDKKGDSTPTLSVEVYDGEYEKVTDVPVVFEVEEGTDLLEIVQDGYSCSFVAKGHGTAKLCVRVSGNEASAEYVTVNVIVPPEAVTLPEVFAERPIEYAFSLVDSLPFAPGVTGEALACKDVDVEFFHISGASGDEVAVYEDGKITFKMTGKVIATVKSASGSKVEAKTTYTFDINDGYNVYNFAELDKLVSSSEYTGAKPINFVVLEKPVGQGADYTYKYGYDLVPPVALLPQAEQTVEMITRGVEVDGRKVDVTIGIYNKGVWINGNNHKIDASQVRIYTKAEMLAYNETNNFNLSNITDLLYIAPSGEGDAYMNKSYKVVLNNVDTVGNCPIDYDPTKYTSDGENRYGVISYGISIGDDKHNCKYYVQGNNLSSAAFFGGFNLMTLVDSKLSNVYAYNCYSTGILSLSNIVEFENLKFGPCGATGIELTPKDCTVAGANDNENQKVTISGTLEASFLNGGDTNYFKNYSVMGATVPMIINGNVAAYPEIFTNHIRNSEGKFIFVALTFMDTDTFAPNTSVVEYPPYLAGGIIDIANLPQDGSYDTTHQYIRMPIMADITGVGTVEVGTALFINLKYTPAE